MKRFIGASLARDPKIKENASNALTEVNSKVANVSTLNKAAFQNYFLQATDMKDCKTKQ